MANIFLRFPGGTDKALTLSYDDGVEQDIRLMEIMKKHGLKGTFNLNSGCYAPEGTVYPEGQIHRRMTLKQAQELYKDSGMEVAVHGLTHPFLEKLSVNCCNYEVLQDRVNLEKEYGCIVRGMAYPYGTYNDEVVDVLKNCGIVYSRTIKDTESFDIPTDWLRLPATCHHSNPRLMELAERFLEQDRYGKPYLFYLWGHSYEFESDNNWNVIEEFAEYVGHHDNVWYATNIEIFDYLTAYNQLIFNAACDKVYNPTCTELYFHTENGLFCVKPGETITFA